MRFRLSIFRIAVIVLFCAAFLIVGPTQAEGTTSTSGSPAPSLWVTPLVIDFGSVGVGFSGDTLAVTIHNTGNATLTDFAGGGVASPFSATQNCAGGVPPGGACQYFFTFSPITTGTFAATSSSSTNAGPIAIQLRGVGVGAELHANPLSLDFGSVYAGSISAQQIVTIRNTGLATLTDFAGGGVASPFSATQNCAGGVPPGGACQYFFTFSPMTAGTFTATSNSSTNAGLFSVDLLGRGREVLFSTGLRVTPRSLNFGPVGVGLSGDTLVVDITNQSFSSITNFAGGGVASPFNATQNCAPTLPVGGTCQFFYTFSPDGSGEFTTTSNVSTSGGSFSIDMRGEGVGADSSVSPLELDLGSIMVGNMSAVQVVNIKNMGMATMTDFAGGGVASPFNAAQNCAPALAPGDTCEFFYSFSPTEWGRFTATSNVSTSGGSFSILLTGGVDLPAITQTFSPNQIPSGGTTTLRYTISNLNSGATLFETGFNNTFPTGVRVAAPLAFSYSTECGSPTFTPIVGATSVTFADATIMGGDDCVVTLDVSAENTGVFTNATDPVTSASGTGNAASATLTVNSRIFLPAIVK